MNLIGQNDQATDLVGWTLSIDWPLFCIKQTLFEILASEDCYIDLPEIVEKVKLNLFSS